MTEMTSCCCLRFLIGSALHSDTPSTPRRELGGEAPPQACAGAMGRLGSKLFAALTWRLCLMGLSRLGVATLVLQFLGCAGRTTGYHATSSPLLRDPESITHVSYKTFATSATGNLNREDVSRALSLVLDAKGTHILFMDDGVTSSVIEVDPADQLNMPECSPHVITWGEAYELIFSAHLEEPCCGNTYPSRKLLLIRTLPSSVEIFAMNPVDAWALPLAHRDWSRGEPAQFLCLLRAVAEAVPRDRTGYVVM